MHFLGFSWDGVGFSPSPRPVDSRLRGNDGPWWLCWLVVCSTLHLWIADQVRNDGTMVVLHRFTLTFDSSPIKGEGKVVGLDLLLPCHPSGLRIKSAMT